MAIVERHSPRTIGGILAGLALALCILRIASAQTGDGWTRMGSLSAGAYSRAVDPANPASMYALGSEGISHSTDKGSTWTVCNREARGMRVVAPLPGQTGTLTLY